MPKLPVLSGQDAVKILIRIGYVHVRTSGDHAILKYAFHEKQAVLIYPTQFKRAAIKYNN